MSGQVDEQAVEQWMCRRMSKVSREDSNTLGTSPHSRVVFPTCLVVSVFRRVLYCIVCSDYRKYIGFFL